MRLFKKFCSEKIVMNWHFVKNITENLSQIINHKKKHNQCGCCINNLRLKKNNLSSTILRYFQPEKTQSTTLKHSTSKWSYKKPNWSDTKLNNPWIESPMIDSGKKWQRNSTEQKRLKMKLFVRLIFMVIQSMRNFSI